LYELNLFKSSLGEKEKEKERERVSEIQRILASEIQYLCALNRHHRISTKMEVA